MRQHTDRLEERVKSRSKKGLRARAALVVLAGTVAGCGGGGSGVGSPPPPPSNRAPQASDASLSTTEDVQVIGNVTANDADGQTLTFAVSRQPAHGGLSLNWQTGRFIYTPGANFAGADDFQFTASDGKVASNPAQVSIQVSPVNDAPVIERIDAPVGGEPGQSIAVVVQASDPEGPVTVEISQTGGIAVTNLVRDDRGIEFRLPDTDTSSDAAFRVRVVDNEGVAVEREFAVSDWPVSGSGKLTTLFGSTTSPGLHWVITGDGFRASERAVLLTRAREMVDPMLADPLLRSHRGIWNVHVLTVASQESGADVPSLGEKRDTAFDGTFDCAGIARLLCVDWSKVQAQVIPEFAGYDALLVIVNSDRYGGSGSSMGAVTSLHPTAPRLLLHEMGHSFAGLGDEYVSSTDEAARGGFFIEGDYPNLTQQTDATKIPWRHWFVDPNNIPTTPFAEGIGRFEGGYYSATGFYRPTFNSFMRNLEGALNSVHAEAWTRSLYRHVSPILGSSPAPGALTLATDERRTFGVLRAFAGDVESVRWYLDGNEVVAARDNDHLECCTAIAGSHTLRVDVADSTGVIRLPDATEGIATRSWDLTIDPNLAPGGVAQPAAKAVPVEREDRWFIRVRVDEAGHHVEDIARVSGAVKGAQLPAGAGAGAFHFEITDTGGAILSAGEVADPRIMRGPLPLPGERTVGHAWIRQTSGSYIIQVPDAKGMRYLRIGSATPAVSKMQAGNAFQVIDLARSSSLIR
jgi:VCBS repeat-containing protein